MTEKSNAGHEVSRREFMVVAGAAAAVGGAIGATATPAAAAGAANEICRMDAVTPADKVRTKQLSPTGVTEAVLSTDGEAQSGPGRILHALTRRRAGAGEGDRGGHHGWEECGPTRWRASRHQGLGLH